MLGACVADSLSMLLPTLWMPVDFTVVKCTLVLHSGTSGSVIIFECVGSGMLIPLCKSRCFADDYFLVIGLFLGSMVACAFVNLNGMTRCWNCQYRRFVLVTFHDLDYMTDNSGRN